MPGDRDQPVDEGDGRRWVICESAWLGSFPQERGMPGPRLPMRKIRDVLRLSAAGMSKRKIAASLGVSATAAGECIRRARCAGLAWPLPEELSDEALERRLFPPLRVALKNRRPQPARACIKLVNSKNVAPEPGNGVAL